MEPSFILIAVTVVVAVSYILYYIYLSRLEGRECDLMNTLYPAIDGYIAPVGVDCSGALYDYYIKTAFNACSGGSYRNDFVDVCNLKAVIKQGVRCLDFEVYLVDDRPVVATSTTANFHVKETFNSVPFSDVMNTVVNYGFAGGTCPNPTDPLLLHLRIMSEHQRTYTLLADIFAGYDQYMLDENYSFENLGSNLGAMPLLSFQNKIILVVDKNNSAFLENAAFLEYVNLTSNSMYMRTCGYETGIKNNPDTQELTAFNRTGMTIVLPERGATNPPNPSALLCRTYGCQMVAMRYQQVDNYLEENAAFFDTAGYAFVLKPAALRNIPVTIADPTPQNTDYNYATRTAATDYYNFSY